MLLEIIIFKDSRYIKTNCTYIIVLFHVIGGDEFIIVCERDKNEEIMPVFNDLQRLFQQSHEGLPDF